VRNSAQEAQAGPAFSRGCRLAAGLSTQALRAGVANGRAAPEVALLYAVVVAVTVVVVAIIAVALLPSVAVLVVALVLLFAMLGGVAALVVRLASDDE
jgi:hypothetical protein